MPRRSHRGLRLRYRRGLRIKTNSARGGTVENIFARDIEIGNLLFAPIEIDLRYMSETGTFVPTVRNIVVERMHSAHSQYGLYIRAFDQTPLRGVVVRDSAFRGVTNGHVSEGDVDLTLTDVTVEVAPAQPVKGKS